MGKLWISFGVSALGIVTAVIFGFSTWVGVGLAVVCNVIRYAEGMNRAAKILKQ